MSLMHHLMVVYLDNRKERERHAHSTGAERDQIVWTVTTQQQLQGCADYSNQP
jgi:hypothetical protein